ACSGKRCRRAGRPGVHRSHLAGPETSRPLLRCPASRATGSDGVSASANPLDCEQMDCISARQRHSFLPATLLRDRAVELFRQIVVLLHELLLHLLVHESTFLFRQMAPQVEFPVGVLLAGTAFWFAAASTGGVALLGRLHRLIAALPAALGTMSRL